MDIAYVAYVGHTRMHTYMHAHVHACMHTYIQAFTHTTHARARRQQRQQRQQQPAGAIPRRRIPLRHPMHTRTESTRTRTHACAHGSSSSRQRARCGGGRLPSPAQPPGMLRRARTHTHTTARTHARTHACMHARARREQRLRARAAALTRASVLRTAVRHDRSSRNRQHEAYRSQPYGAWHGRCSQDGCLAALAPIGSQQCRLHSQSGRRGPQLLLSSSRPPGVQSKANTADMQKAMNKKRSFLSTPP